MRTFALGSRSADPLWCGPLSNWTAMLRFRPYLLVLAVVCAPLLASCSNDPPPLGRADAGDVDVDERSDAGDADVEITDTAEDVDASDAADAGGEAVPLIHEAELCEPANPDPSVVPGTDLMKVTLQSDRAVCNDGSPAVIYVRPAPEGSANTDRWVVWLESGGGCNSASECRTRWCSGKVAKMSSRFAPDGIRADGIFDADAANDFADWNHVVAYYCSSDSWSGRQRTSAVDGTGAVPPYELWVHGAYIVDEIISTLKAGAESDDGSMTMPSLDDASMLLFTGTSAGSGGVRSNADRVGDMLRQTNPSVDYRIVADAGLTPIDPHPPELTEADALALLDFKHEVFVNWRNGATDESCLRYHADDPRWCSDNSHLMFHHISTPAFAKQDLRDGAPGAYADVPTYSAVTFEWLSDVAARTFVPEETDVPISQAGVFAPACDHHLNLTVTSFYEVRVTNGTESRSMHDLLSNWAHGEQPVQAIHDTTAGLTSVCP